MNLERSIVEHAAPTLAGLKTASLFTAKIETAAAALSLHIRAMNERFKQKGVQVRLLKISKGTALIYVFRENMLQADMQDPIAGKILARYGYSGLSSDKALVRLSKRLHNFEEFPHEIGLFLGYPPEDVEGFICYKGKDCRLCGYWKVYGDTEDALQKFARYDKCKAVYRRLWHDGRDILQLTVQNRQPA